MKHEFFLSLLFLISFVPSSDAYSVKRYRGDGHLVDQGWWFPGHRYILDLGPIEISESKKYEYKLLGLPLTRMTLGFEVPNPAVGNCLCELFFPKPIRPIVKMIVTDSQGREVIREEGPLHEWTWSGSSTDSFIYRNGGEKDAGKGTAFVPRTKEQYTLRIEILKPVSTLGKQAVKLIAVGGGWK
jgi:hypothetical protein